MKSVVWEVAGCHFFLFLGHVILMMPGLGVAFVGAARRSLARDSRSELGD